MSSWVRDMAMKPPQRPESIPVLESPTLMISELGPVRKFDLPITRRSQLREAQAQQQLKLEQEQEQDQSQARAWNTVGPPIVNPENSVIRTFENTSRLKFGQPANRMAPRAKPQTQPEPWAKIEPAKKRTPQQEAPPVSQLARPENPIVTVVLETNKDTEFLEASLQSISRQTFSNWVGIIVLRSKEDDLALSVRRSLVKLQLGQVFSVMQMDEKTTSPEALQTAIEAATTKYIAFATNTDLWTAKKLEQQVAELEAKPEVGIIGSMSRYFGDRVELAKIPPGPLTEDDFKTGNPMIFPSVLIRRELVTFTNDFENFEFDGWVRSITQGVNITNLSPILTLQRVNFNKQVPRKDDKDDIRSKYNLV